MRRNLFRMSERMPAVAIFLAKNFLGMADKIEHTGNEDKPIKAEITVVSAEARQLTNKIIEGKGTDKEG